MSGESDEAVLSKRATQLALARTQALSPKETITARTLAMDSAAETLPALSMAGPSLDPRDLPKISIDERALHDAPPLGQGATRADYALVSTIGEGGMGRVHLAHQRSLDRDVALKTLKPDSPPAVASALLREARLTGSLEHPGVIPVHALGVDDLGRPMLVMKRVDGVDLAALLAEPDHAAWRSRGADRVVASVEILIQVCHTLELAHSRGVVHRDIKPANVMVGGFGEVYLLDWGIARAGQTSRDPAEDEAFVGTPVYMAPEMVRGVGIDARTDVYLLGATLHEILTGRGRHEGETMMDIIRAAMRSEPATYDAGVPEELARLANRATARDPDERPSSAAAFRETLVAFLRHRSARALADAATARTAELEALLARTGVERVPSDLARAYRLATEARFGLTESLRAYSGEHTRAAMRRCLAAAIELELRQEHADSAAALLREMDPPDAALDARIAAIRELDAARARDRERLASLDHDLDPSVEASSRTRPLVALLALATAVGAFFSYSGMTPTPSGIAWVAAFILGVVGATVFLLQRRKLTTAFNRRASGLLVLGGVAMVGNRLLGVYLDRAPATTLAIDLYLYAVLFAASAITVLPQFWGAGVVALAGAVYATVHPDHAVAVFVPTLGLSLLVCIVVLARARRTT